MRQVRHLPIAVAVGLAIQLTPGILQADPRPAPDAPLYTGGGVTLTQEDVDRILASAGPRGGGMALIVECNGAYGYAWIQQAVDAASDGDVVVVLPNDCEPDGWYHGFDIRDKDIRVQSAFPADPDVVAATIISEPGGPAPSTLVTMDDPGLQAAVLDGLTFADSWYPIVSNNCRLTISRCAFTGNYNGSVRAMTSQLTVVDSTFVGNAFGIQILSNSQALISGCEFTLNGSTTLGAGVESNDSDLVIEDSIFTENGTSYPAGAVSQTGGDLRMSRCEFEGNYSGALRALTSQSTVVDSTFVDNAFGIQSSSNSNSAILGCVFTQNGPTLSGAGILSLNGDLLIEDCGFIRNEATDKGGAVSHVGGHLHVSRCTFAESSARRGGAIDSSNSSVLHISACSFEYNRASGSHGGAINLRGPPSADSTVSQCRFVGNSATGWGGALRGSPARLTSCSFVGNSATYGAGISHAPASLTMTDSVFWNNRGQEGSPEQQQIWFSLSSPLTAAYSCIQGLDVLTGNGNINTAPAFVDPGYWDNNGTPGDLTDDFFVAGDYHLLPGSPCIDAGDPDFVAEAGAVDLDGEPRVMHCRVDMGVDEFTLSEPLAGDYDNSGALDIADLAPLIDALLEPTASDACIGDLNGDGSLDGLDIAALVDALLDV